MRCPVAPVAVDANTARLAPVVAVAPEPVEWFVERALWRQRQQLLSGSVSGRREGECVLVMYGL